jgi:hypothetical protein
MLDCAAGAPAGAPQLVAVPGTVAPELSAQAL